MKRSLVPVFSVVALIASILASRAGADLPDAKLAALGLRGDRASYAPGSVVKLEARVTVEPEWHVNSHTPSFAWLIPTVLELELPAGVAAPHIEYPIHELQTFAFADEPVAVYEGQFVIRAEFPVPPGYGTPSLPIKAVLRYQACNQTQCVAPSQTAATMVLVIGTDGPPTASEEEAAEVPGMTPAVTVPVATVRKQEPDAPPTIDAPVAPAIAAAPEPAPPPVPSAPPASARGLASILLLAFLGGVILNAMPCVLPVLSLKVLSLVEGASHGRRGTVLGSLATTAGIFVSFWALALAAIVAKSAGSAVGWGVQFQNPLFVTALLVVVLLFSMNLWGLFEIPLPTAFARWGGAGPSQGLGGHFASGLFATLLATPCSAPFLGTALGFALSRPAGTILAVFTAVAAGLAAPYLLLVLIPGFDRVLPRPGVWMLTLRGFLGFLLAATAIWLLYVLGGQVSRVRLAGVELAMLGVALFVWLQPRARGVLGRAFAWGGVLVAVGAALALAVAPAEGHTASLAIRATPQLISWVPFDRTRAESLAKDGRAVFVDVTADWCFTCKVIESRVLETESVAAAFRRHGIVPMRADWTNRDPTIAAFLEDNGRFGIPFYLLYRPGQAPRVFSELLTKEALLEAVADLPEQP